MKRTLYDRPIESGRKKDLGGRAPKPDSLASRCKAAGVTINPDTIRSRMNRHDISFEEAVAWQPEEGTTKGRKGKQKSHWSKVTPDSKLDHQIAQGRAPRGE